MTDGGMDGPGAGESVMAELFDGTSARRRPVRVGWGDAGLTLATGGVADAETIDWDQLTFIDAAPGVLIVGHAMRGGWRLKLPADMPAGLRAHLPRPHRFGSWIDRVGLARALALFTVASAAVVGVVVTLPLWLGPLVPVAWERQIGEGVVGNLSPYSCTTPASEAALARLVGEMDSPQPGQPPVRVQLIKLDMINAVAVPGARVLVFDGLVQQARSPDELAGVIGHEIGHVRKRHVMQAMLREFGLSALLSQSKSALGNTLGQLTALRYSRQAEGEADAWSRARLAAADISPVPTADFFARLAAKDPSEPGGVAIYFASHPDTAAPEQAFRAGFRPGHTYRPALNQAQFAAIVGACKQDHRAKAWSPFGP